MNDVDSDFTANEAADTLSTQASGADFLAQHTQRELIAGSSYLVELSWRQCELDCSSLA